MDASTSVSDPRFGYELAWQLNQLFAGPNLDRVRNSIAVLFGEQFTAQEWAVSDLCPQTAMFASGTITIVLCQGIRTADQVGALALSYIENRNLRENFGFVRSADRVADTIMGRLEASGWLANNRIILAGHSYGGMCLHSLASRLARSSTARVVSLATFGSPAPGDDRIAVAMQRVDLARYMNVGDNVVYCPPNGDYAPVMHLLLDRLESLGVNQIVQCGRGPVLTAEGVITQAGYPPDPGFFTDVSIANFLVRNESPVAMAHAIGEYERRLALWVESNPPVPARARGAGNEVGIVQPVEVPPFRARAGDESAPVPMPVVGGGVGAAGAPVDGGVMAGVAGPVDPRPALGIPPPQVAPTQTPLAYRVRKVGKSWTVYYMEPERVVMVAKGKTQARRFAARMNGALSGWNNALHGDEAAFEQSAIDAFN